MPLQVTLTEKLADGIWNAVGQFSNSAGLSGDASVLLKEVDGGLQLHLDDSIRASKLMDRQVLAYHNAEVLNVKKPKKGIELVTTQPFWFNLLKK